MSAIPCASVSLKTMADGTLRISFDIEPMHAQDAFRLFAAPGTPAAIAALQVGYAQVSEVTKVSEPLCNPEKPKGGPLAKLAGMWCADQEFQQWLWERADYTGEANGELCAATIRSWCGIESRAELDSNPEAAEKFHRFIRGPYSKHLMARGIVA